MLGHPTLRRASVAALALPLHLLLLLLALLAPVALGVPAHDEPGLVNDAQPPYEGPGYAGDPLTPDADGRILDFDAQSVTLLSWIPIPEFPGGNTRANDVWGYVSPSGREYAILGLERGFGFVEVSDPSSPRIVGFIPGSPSIWRDMKVRGEYAYMVHDIVSGSTTAGEGLVVADLRRIDEGIVTQAASLTDFGLRTSHNLGIDPASPTAFLCGSNLQGPDISNAGLIAVDLSNPAAPAFTLDRVWSETYVHDVIVTTYEAGPYAGRQLAFAACGSVGLRVIDVTDKTAMTTIGSLVYPNTSYCHHSWLSPDRRLLYINDELDEVQDPDVTTTTTYVVDVSDPASPRYLRSFTNGLPAIDHNPMGRDGYLYEANYRSGLRIYDIRTPGAEREVAFFDTYPADDEPHFNGAWGVYVGLPSRVVLVGDIERGLFVFDHPVADVPGDPGGGGAALALAGAPNPFRDRTDLHLRLPAAGRASVRVLDARGRTVATLLDRVLPAGSHVVTLEASSALRDAAAGVYFAVLETRRGSVSRRLVLLR